jgi:GT2 family glycosyltransferase
MKIVVVIVTYNPKKWLHKCLSSLQRSTVAMQTIVVDNKSTDGSPLIIKGEFPEVILIESDENYGFGRGNNIGIQKALTSGADYVFLLNQDAWIEPNTVANLIAAHQKEPQYGVVSPMHLNGKGDALDYSFSTYINARHCKGLFSDICLGRCATKVYEAEFINAAAWLISRQCIEKVGGFNPSFFHYGEDDNYIQRIKFHGFKIGVFPHTVIYHDREVNSKDQFFTDQKKIYRQSLILKLSNPFRDYSFTREYKKKFYFLFKSILLLKFHHAKSAFCDLIILNSMDKNYIIENKVKSRKIQPSFLKL